MENPKGTEKFRAQRLALGGRLKNVYENAKPHETRILITGGCGDGWSEYTSVRSGSGETEEQIRERVQAAETGLIIQHEHECGDSHGIARVSVVLNRLTIQRADYWAKHIVDQLNVATGFKP